MCLHQVKLLSSSPWSTHILMAIFISVHETNVDPTLPFPRLFGVKKYKYNSENDV